MLLQTDTKEDELRSTYLSVLDELLRDHTSGQNILWATDDYASMGDGYGWNDRITIDKITGNNGDVIKPRALKKRDEQQVRTKQMAEVFTPSWVCNAQNNLIDEAWFGRTGVFNIENEEEHTWQTTTESVTFPEGKTWKDYVRATRMEITCGEAPYLVSRYDTTTGQPIPLKQRIGMLDRKLRIVSENTETTGEWLKMAQEAYKHTYGYEWQGDNLLLAREALLISFIEYYTEKFGNYPLEKSIQYIAYIVSWNIFQMDGLKGVIPASCRHHVEEETTDLFGTSKVFRTCDGCEKGTLLGHNGIYCLIRDWGNKDPKTGENNRKIRFIDLIRR